MERLKPIQTSIKGYMRLCQFTGKPLTYFLMILSDFMLVVYNMLILKVNGVIYN